MMMNTILELVALAGFYHLVSFLVRATGVEHEPWAERFPVDAVDAEGRHVEGQ